LNLLDGTVFFSCVYPHVTLDNHYLSLFTSPFYIDRNGNMRPWSPATIYLSRWFVTVDEKFSRVSVKVLAAVVIAVNHRVDSAPGDVSSPLGTTVLSLSSGFFLVFQKCAPYRPSATAVR
jgi:hypothetical protein